MITLHLRGKTEGEQKFAISLAGPGVKATNAWTVPQLVLREASKQQGTLLLVPEQGLRLQVVTRDGLTQLDPQKSGIRQKGVLAFRVLQTPWNLVLGLEQVDPWIQVTSLQHATVNEALVKIAANLQYQIENTGLKAFRVFVPTNAESLRFQGEQVADFLPVAGAITNGLQQWEVKLHRRVIGSYLLQATYQTPVPERASETVLRGLQAADVNLQRGFVTVQAGGRLQVRIDTPPAALQATEWQSIPRALAAEPARRLGQLRLPPRRARLRASLAARTPRGRQAPARPRQQHHLHLRHLRRRRDAHPGAPRNRSRRQAPPQPHAAEGRPLLVRLRQPERRLAVARAGPHPDSARAAVPRRQSHPRGDLLQRARRRRARPRARPGARCAQVRPAARKPHLARLPERQVAAQGLDGLAPVAAGRGRRSAPPPWTCKPTFRAKPASNASAPRKPSNSWRPPTAPSNRAIPSRPAGPSRPPTASPTSDAAFNEDARVQLHNIKLQQALVGLNVRQATAAGDPAAVSERFLRDLRGRKEVSYTQQDAKDIIDRNTADDNAAYMRLAERLIQQQDAAVTSPTAIRANIPEQGRVLTFKRAVVVDPWADLQIRLAATAAKAASWGVRLLILAATLVILAVFAWAARAFRPANRTPGA